MNAVRIPATPLSTAGVSRNVVALGVVSLLTDLSSDMIIPVLPAFVTITLGASVTSLGLIEGVAESASSLLRIGSGWLSDRSGRRKPFLLFGYGLSTVAKAAFALAATWPQVLACRFADRLGKGVRNPPRDALIADSTVPAAFGRAFGLHRAMDTLGAALGPLAAIAVLQAFPEDYRRLFLIAAIPGALSLVVLVGWVRAPRRDPIARHPGTDSRAAPLGPAFRRFLLVTGIFSLANSSLAFLLLRATQVGFSTAQAALIYLGFNLVYAVLSWPIGALSDRIGRRPMVLWAYVLFAALYASLAWNASPWWVAGAFMALGVHSALIEGSQRGLLADLVPPARRATAYGTYYTVVGLAVLPGNAAAGLLWDRFGARAMFGADAALALLAAALFAALLPSRREIEERHRADAF